MAASFASSQPSSTAISIIARRAGILCLPSSRVSAPRDYSYRTISCSSSTPSSASKVEEYNRTMQRQMRNPYEYHHDLGIYYTRILDDIIVGSQPQTIDDIDRLYHNEGIGAILNLQQDKDIEYWEVDFNSITERSEQLGIAYLRNPAQDFDPNSLREQLPKAVCLLEWAKSEGKTVYIHCTAGLGRAPATAIAYLFWFHGMNLDDAYKFLTSKRPCGPNKEAIRGATYDLAKNNPFKEPFETLPEYAFTDISSWERQLIQEKIRGMRNTLKGLKPQGL